MTTRAGTGSEAWAFTDVEGRIESASRGMGSMLRVGGLLRGDDLLHLFPLPRKALLCDITAALQGWPTTRTMTIDAPGLRARQVRYRVSRRLQDTGVGLFWLFDELSSGAVAASAA